MRLLILLSIPALIFSCNQREQLPIFGPKELVVKMIDGQEVVDTLYNTIPDFNFINQDGKKYTEEDLS
jgi:protein SCO1